MPGERNGVFRMSSFPDTPTHLLRKMIKQPVTDEENDAWAEFVELYEPVIRAYIAVEGVASSDADDAVQNVFMRLVGILRRGGYDRSKGRFRAYLKVVMRRVIIDLFRRQTAARMDVQVPFEEEETDGKPSLPDAMAALAPDAAAEFEAKWQKARLSAALNHVFTQTAISDQSREIYRAHALNGEDAREVARRFGVTPEVVRQVKSRISRMVAALVRRMGV